MAPIINPARQLPIVSFSDWDNVNSVKAAIRQLENGYFDAASQVVDAMGRDDRISGVTLTRSGALPSLPMTMEPFGDGRQKTMVAKEAEEVWVKMFPDHALSELLHWGIFLGVGLGQLLWTTLEDRWVPKLKVWHPKFLRWDYNTQAYWVTTADGQRRVEPGNGEWVLFTPYGDERGWMYGKVRSLYVPWLIRQWALRDWARYSEVHGLPIRKAVTPAGAEQEDKDRFLREVANIGSEATIRTPRVPGEDPDSSRFDVELVEAVGRSTETFAGLIDKADTCIAVAVLGQNLTTEVQGGSYAATLGHMQIRGDVLQSDDQRLGQCIQEQALRWWCFYNFQSPALAPRPHWETKPPEDKKLRGESIKALGEGIAAVQAVGGKPDVDQLLEDAEVPTTGPAEKLPSLEEQRQAEADAAANVDKEERAMHSAATRDAVPTAAVEGQLYVDDVATAGTRAASKEMAPDLATVLAIVQKASSFEALRDELRTAYETMSRKQFAALLRDALVLSELHGRYAVTQEAEDDEVA